MADRKLVDDTKNPSRETIKEEGNQTKSATSFLSLFDDDETDAFHILPQNKQHLFVNVSNYDFTKPVKRFNIEVSYDSAQEFFQDLGFNKLTIDRLKLYFDALKEFVDYDVYAIIERLEADLLLNEDNEDKLIINSQQDFFEALRLFGFENEWAQTYTWAMGEAYADQLVKNSIEECIRLRLSFTNVIQPYPDWTSNLPNNQWQTHHDPQFRDDQNFFIRKQDRPAPNGFDRDLNVIGFNILTNLTRPNHANAQYWFHATDWEGAENILRNGISGQGKNTDFSKGPAYYLNNNYRDCYRFLFKRNHKFNGRHAILIYEFNPQQLSDGHYIWIDNDTPAAVKTWKQIVFSCMNYNQNEVGDLTRCRCVFGWQCANATEFQDRRGTVDAPQRRTRSFDNQYAEQLAIRTNRMWPKVDDHFIGIIIFQHS